jgi:hypothetical protein
MPFMPKIHNFRRQGWRLRRQIRAKKMAYNVPAVYDVLPARIEKCVAFLGLAKCAGATAWEWNVAE